MCNQVKSLSDVREPNQMGLSKGNGPNSWLAYHIVLGFVHKVIYDDQE